MSVVVAIKDGDNVIIGCDSQVSSGYTKKTLSNKNNYKIFRPSKDKDVIIGVCGDLRDRDILYCIDEYIDELTKSKDEVDYKYIVKTIVPKIFNILDNQGRIIYKKDEHKKMDVHIVFIYKNKIYDISSWGAVKEIDDYCCIGSGEDLAMGYLNQSEETDNELKLIKAIKSACKSDLYVNYPIIIMNSKDEEIKVIEN